MQIAKLAGSHVIAYDSVGGQIFDAFLDNLAMRGRLVISGHTSDFDKPVENVPQPRAYHKLYWKSASVRAFQNQAFPEYFDDIARRILELYYAGRLKVLVDDVLEHLEHDARRWQRQRELGCAPHQGFGQLHVHGRRAGEALETDVHQRCDRDTRGRDRAVVDARLRAVGRIAVQPLPGAHLELRVEHRLPRDRDLDGHGRAGGVAKRGWRWVQLAHGCLSPSPRADHAVAALMLGAIERRIRLAQRDLPARLAAHRTDGAAAWP